MIRVNCVKLHIGYTDTDIRAALIKKLRIKDSELIAFTPVKLSLDARKKDSIFYVMSLDVSLSCEKRILSDKRISDVSEAKSIIYDDPFSDTKALIKPNNRPIVVGFGPAGIFAALMLARAGFKPIVFERGADVDTRTEDVQNFWQTGKLNTQSNVQFGEGGAGTFSDGKLNSMIHDGFGRIAKVYSVFIENGADSSIAYINKPHIGTDKLRQIIKSIREQIKSLGGEIHFNSTVSSIDPQKDGTVIVTVNSAGKYITDDLVLAIGHSARDTFSMLVSKGFAMERKPFAVGMRVQHPQELIGRSQYGDAYTELPAADYKLTYNSPGGRSVYSFCMCPGGFVVNASSEEQHLAVNGMSNSGRDEKTANSAIVVSVTEDDFDGSDVLAGVRFQQKLEHLCYKEGQGSIPVQYLVDFAADRATVQLTDNAPNVKGSYICGNLRNVLPDFISKAILEAFPSFGHKIHGFDDEHALFIGLESRTSSPVRIIRGDNLQSVSYPSIYPCGEGAGYAGGITSAAVDGLKVYEAIINKYLK